MSTLQFNAASPENDTNQDPHLTRSVSDGQRVNAYSPPHKYEREIYIHICMYRVVDYHSEKPIKNGCTNGKENTYLGMKIIDL